MVFGIVILVLLGFAVAIAWRPATIIAFAFSVYAFEQWAQANSSYFGANASFMNLAFGVLTLWALVVIVLRGQNPLNPTTGAYWTWAALFFYAGVSCLWSIDRDVSVFLFKYNFPYMLTFAGIVPLVLRRSEDLYKSLLASLAFGAFVMVLLLISTRVHAWGRTIAVDTAIVDRVGQSRTRLAPLAVAEMAGHMLILAVMMNFRGIHRIWQYLRWGIVFLALGLIYRSGSRGQLIASLLTIVIWITFSRGTKRAIGWVTAGVSTALISGFAVLSFIGFADHTRSRWDLNRMQEQFGSTRLGFSAKLLDYWFTSGPIAWIFGLGSSASYDERINGIYCHVVIVEILCELGLIGFLIAMALLVFIGRDSRDLYRLTQEDDVARGATVALLAACTFQVILAFKQGSFLTHTFTFCCALMIARHSALVRREAQKEKAMELQKRWYYYYAQLAQQGGSVGGQTAT
jgi:hypothetical protein